MQSTYRKGDLRDKVTGPGGLLEQFRKRIKDDNNKTTEEKQQLAEYRLSLLDQALNVDLKKPTKEALEEAEDIGLASEMVTSDDVRFVIECITKQAPDDKEPTTQLIYGMFTAFTKTPMSHNTNSRDSGAGKSYIILNVADHFPEKYVMQKNAVSNKAIFHRRGVLVQKVTDGITGKEHFEPIVHEIGKLFAEKKLLEDKVEEEKEEKKEKKPQDTKQQLKKWRNEISQINSRIEEIRDNALNWINLENEILLALDTPQDGFLEALMSIISQDTTRDQEYEFVEKTTTGKIINRINILHGTPCIFTSRTIDETRTLRHEEKTRRLINVTPNTCKEKIKHASDAIISSHCLLPIEYEHNLGLFQQDKEKCKHIVAVLVAKIKRHSKFLQQRQTGVRVSFEESVRSAMPTGKDHEVWLMTVSGRLIKYLAIITKVNMDSRWKIVDTETGQFWPISTYEDLREAMMLMKSGASSIRLYQTEFYNNRFLPLFKAFSEK